MHLAGAYDERERARARATYWELSMFKLLDILDTYLSLAQSQRAKTFSISEKVSDPANLALLIRLSVETMPNIQLMAHRILQKVLFCDLPVQVLN